MFITQNCFGIDCQIYIFTYLVRSVMCINSNYTMSIFFIYARTPHKTLTDICSCQGMHDSLRRKKLSSNIQIKIKLEQELMFWNLATFGCLDRHQNSLIMNRICNVVLELFLPFSLHIMTQILWNNYLGQLFHDTS